MMVRDHWTGCSAMPPKLKGRFLSYQEHKIPSSSLSREYWAYAATKIGMVNTEYGITITTESIEAAAHLPSFGTTPEHVAAMQEPTRKRELLVEEDEKATSAVAATAVSSVEGNGPKDDPHHIKMSPFLRCLLSQTEQCYMLESERVGKRKEAPVGLSGFGCRHCIAKGRLGFCRVFPLNKRSLPTKVHDLYNHFQRCPLTPAATRALLRQHFKQQKQMAKMVANRTTISSGKKNATNQNTKFFSDRDREYIDQIWNKLGRTGAQI